MQLNDFVNALFTGSTSLGAGQIFSLDASCGVFLVPVGIEAVTVQGGADG